MTWGAVCLENAPQLEDVFKNLPTNVKWSACEQSGLGEWVSLCLWYHTEMFHNRRSKQVIIKDLKSYKSYNLYGNFEPRESLGKMTTWKLSIIKSCSQHITVQKVATTVWWKLNLFYLKILAYTDVIFCYTFVQTSVTWNSHFSGSYSTPEWATNSTGSMNDKFVVNGTMRNTVVG